MKTIAFLSLVSIGWFSKLRCLAMNMVNMLENLKTIPVFVSNNVVIKCGLCLRKCC